MSAQRAMPVDDAGDGEMLDVETSAAILRWMETALVPDGVNAKAWEDWMDGGCRGRLEVDGAPVTSTMLGRWARSGSLR